MRSCLDAQLWSASAWRAGKHCMRKVVGPHAQDPRVEEQLFNSIERRCAGVARVVASAAGDAVGGVRATAASVRVEPLLRFPSNRAEKYSPALVPVNNDLRDPGVATPVDLGTGEPSNCRRTKHTREARRRCTRSPPEGPKTKTPRLGIPPGCLEQSIPLLGLAAPTTPGAKGGIQVAVHLSLDQLGKQVIHAGLNRTPHANAQ